MCTQIQNHKNRRNKKSPMSKRGGGERLDFVPTTTLSHKAAQGFAKVKPNLHEMGLAHALLYQAKLKLE